MLPVFFQRKAAAPTVAQLTTNDSAVHSDISRDFSKIYLTSGGSAGTVNVAATAVVTANAGGPGIHGFNSGSQAGVRSRSSFFVSQTSSTTSTFTIFLQTHPGDAVGKKVVIAITDQNDAVLSSTVVTLTNVLTAYSTSVATTPENEFHAKLTNDPGLGADAAARCLVGTQRVFSDAVVGLYAPGYSRIQVESTLWFSNLENFQYTTGSYWAYVTGRGHEVSGFSYLSVVTNAASMAVEMSGNGFATLGADGTGITAILNGVTIQNYDLTVDTFLRHQVVALPGVSTAVQFVGVGRNGRAAGFLGTLYNAVFYRTADSFVTANAAYSENSLGTIAVIGDSISDGFQGIPMVQFAWNSPFTLGAATGRPVVCDSSGGGVVGNFTGPAFIIEEVAKVNQATPSTVIWAYGTNDYQLDGNPPVSLAEFEADLGALCDRVHATNATAMVQVFVIWWKPGFEGINNGQSHTLDDFRDAGVNILATRNNAGWLRVVLTKDWTVSTGAGTTDDYIAGGIHPNNSGMTKILAKVVANVGSPKVTIAPTTLAIQTGFAQTLVASGGTAPYAWLMHTNASGGHINAVTGRYTAGTAAGLDYVQVQDANGQVGTIAITVTASVVAITGASTSLTGGTIAFGTTGGTGPFTWSMASAPSGGSIVAGTGVYTAGATGLYNNQTIDVVHVIDSIGNVAEHDVIVTKPFVLPAGNQLWWKFDTGITTTSTRKASNITDQGPAGHDGSQSIAVHFPFINPIGINGFPTLYFNRGFQSAFATGQPLSAFFTTTQRTLLAVVRLQTVVGTALSGNNAEQNDSVFGDSSGFYQFEFVNDSGSFKLMVNDYTGVDTTLISTAVITPSTPTMVTTHKSGGNHHVQVNQTAEVSAACGATASLGILSYVGAGYAQTRGITGDIAELFVFDNDIGAPAIATVQAYLIEKYNL